MTMKTPYIIAANWKMNKTNVECKIFVDKFKKLLLNIPRSKVIFCPPFTLLYYMKTLLADTPFECGAQNMYWEDHGAFTGEISADMISACGAQYVIIGHSERRQLFGDTDEFINQRISKALLKGLTPIICIGETLEQRNSGQTVHVLQTQLQQGLNEIKSDDISQMIFAYEPVWAIGTGVRAEPYMIQEAHESVRNVLDNMGVANVGVIPILYGGSVKSNNVKKLLEINDVNGFLIGGASLDVDELISIIRQTELKEKE